MSTAYITEFSDTPTYANLPIPKWSRVVEQTPVTVSASHAESAAFASTTRYIWFTCDGIYSFTIGATPAATTGKMRMAADKDLFVGVNPGDKISFITNT